MGKNNWQNWIVGDTPESCIPIGVDEVDTNGNTVVIVQARSAEEACNKGIKTFNRLVNKKSIRIKTR